MSPADSMSPTSDPTHAGATVTLRQFLTTAGKLSTAERELLVDQALSLISAAYVHLPLKRAMHAVDPVQRLRLLRQRLAGLSERQFHDELLAIFVELRDLHTNYELPDPYAGRIAFLPLLIEEFHEDDARRYLVTKVFAGFDDEHLKPGVEITYWNGVPIDRAVDLNAARQAGSNPDASHARGLEGLTIRPMAHTAPPDEEWVVVGFTDGTHERSLRIPWRVFQPDPSPVAADPNAPANPVARALGVDARAEQARRAKKLLFAPAAVAAERAAAADEVPEGESTMPDVLSFKTVTTPDGDFGYVRIWSFSVDDPDAFQAEFVRIIELLPRTGLIVDVRGNGGGVITAGEGLLQLLTPRPIDPARMHFVNTELTLRICATNDFVAEWAPSIAQAVETGEIWSQGFPIVPPETYNQIGQRYHGPVVLVTDALCYSTTDIFAAGFQDHHIGPVLGTSGNTGAGGANVWTHELMREFLPDGPFKALPRNAAMRVAIRRTTRVGPNDGVPVEDLGIVPDARHDMTRADLLESNKDLIAAAGALLAKAGRYRLDAKADKTTGGSRTLSLRTEGLDRVDVWVDGRPRASVDPSGGKVRVNVPAGAVELRGFDGGELAAARRLPA
jgi:hypothetical protein